jgi:hypothetical protein
MHKVWKKWNDKIDSIEVTMHKPVGQVIPLRNDRKFCVRTGRRKFCLSTTRSISLFAIATVFLSPAWAGSTSDGWSDKPTTLSIKEYFDLFLLTKFQDLNPTEPISVNFVPNASKEDALIFIVRPVVTPDFDLTDQSSQKTEILDNFRSNVTKQAAAQIEFTRRLLAQKSVSKRWPGASVERNMAIRFVKADDERETVAITANGKTVFEKNEIVSRSAPIKARAGDNWIE